MDVFINQKCIKLKPKQVLGKGGEADVYDLGKGTALKVFKPPDHPDYQGLPQEQQAARFRLQEHQQKLRQFPYQLPDRVITPDQLATDRQGQQVLGYTMRLLKGTEPLMRYSDRSFRQVGISAQTVVEIFQDLYFTVLALHQAGVILGDFNDLNVLIQGTEAYLIDADSFQFNGFLCRVFSDRFLDPLLGDPNAKQLTLNQPYREESDWYAFTVMLMQCLLFVHPYGGVYQPKDPKDRIPHSQRPLKRITVFHPEVRYPKPALSYGILPDDLLHHFHQVFQQDQRTEFPRQLLDNLAWITCPSCGMEHARITCPHCQTTIALVQPLPIVPTLSSSQATTVTVRSIFETTGLILCATVQGGRLHWLYHEGDRFLREDGNLVVSGHLDNQMQFSLQNKATLVGKNGLAIKLEPHQNPENIAVETRVISAIQKMAFTSNGQHFYWIDQGQLLRNGSLGQVYLGDVLSGQTYIWVGDRFGFGFYRAGNLTMTFLFDGEQPGINDRVSLSLGSGQLIDATCYFSSHSCWFLWTMQEQGQVLNRCALITREGKVEAIAQANLDDDSWLSRLSGKCAAGHFLLAALDEGIVRIECQQGKLIQAKTFPETEPFVSSNCQLLAGGDGLYVVLSQEIKLLKLGH
jgi:H/ACA ribonucleoprotein complex subunit 3